MTLSKLNDHTMFIVFDEKLLFIDVFWLHFSQLIKQLSFRIPYRNGTYSFYDVVDIHLYII